MTSSTSLSLKIQGTQLGVGPLLTIPAATSDELGTGKWQGGLPAIAMYPSSQGLLGGLVQWQASFAGESDRPDTNSLTVQPFGLYLPDGRYLRSTAVWTFDLKNDRYYTPVGFGAGKIWKAGATMDRRTVTAVRSSRSVHGWGYRACCGGRVSSSLAGIIRRFYYLKLSLALLLALISTKMLLEDIFHTLPGTAYYTLGAITLILAGGIVASTIRARRVPESYQVEIPARRKLIRRKKPVEEASR